MKTIAVMAGGVLLALTGCSTIPAATSETELTVARGPCFGFCPVYEIRTHGSDRVEFTGLRHTALLGKITKQVSREAVTDVVRRLDAYRPPAGSADFACPIEVSDQASYTISWQSADGTTASQLRFDSGCQTPEGRALRVILDDLPSTFDLEAESRQLTRPGVGRG